MTLGHSKWDPEVAIHPKLHFFVLLSRVAFTLRQRKITINPQTLMNSCQILFKLRLLGLTNGNRIFGSISILHFFGVMTFMKHESEICCILWRIIARLVCQY